jgi:hypothetical protein
MSHEAAINNNLMMYVRNKISITHGFLEKIAMNVSNFPQVRIVLEEELIRKIEHCDCKFSLVYDL